MPRTFCNDALTQKGRHRVKVRGSEYIMSGSWIDTTAPSDMMDYGMDLSWRDLYEKIRLNNIQQSPPLTGASNLRTPRHVLGCLQNHVADLRAR
jgi:hypothetical protein